MSPSHPSDDLVERAAKAMLNTAGIGELPATVVSNVRRAIAEHETNGLVSRPVSHTRHEDVSWLALAMTLLLIITSGWIIGFRQYLLSEVAGAPVGNQRPKVRILYRRTSRSHETK